MGDDDYGALATKADIADMATIAVLENSLQALELRLTATIERRMNYLILQLAFLLVAVGGLNVAALKLLP